MAVLDLDSETEKRESDVSVPVMFLMLASCRK